MTYNILDGGEGRQHHIAYVIHAARPDVILLQEVLTEDFLKSLAQSLGMTYFLGAGNKPRKVALLSRFPIKAPKSYHPLFPIWRNFVDAQIEYQPNQFIRVLGIHLIANLSGLFELWRLWEATYLIKHAQPYQEECCFIAGDFNAIAPTDKIEMASMPQWLKLFLRLQGNRVYHFAISAFLSAGFTDCFRQCNATENGFTLPPPHPNARLDYIFANAQMKLHLQKCWVVREPLVVTQASDHYPVMAEFSFTH